jgi:S-methylmethionine-dependent homocysteine/selenocysteine methylase
MSQYRYCLPHLGDQPFLTDGGIETTLIFQEGLDLPDFAAFHLLRDESGVATLRKYFLTYAAIAQRFNTGLVLEAATWRASADWGARLGYSSSALAEANRAAIALLDEIRDQPGFRRPVVISGCVGPRGDGYVPSRSMSVDQAADYHRSQIETFAATTADMVTAITMNCAAEAAGVARAAQDTGMPVAISFTVETDGRLPTGQPLGEAILEVEEAAGGFPSYYMLSCAHPEHFQRALTAAPWTARIRGLRANASRMSHAELNEATELDSGDHAEFGSLYAELRAGLLPQMNVMGGCCGTDHRHVEAIAATCLPRFASAAAARS